MGGKNCFQEYKFIICTSSNYGEQYNQIQGKSKYFHILNLFRNKQIKVNCEFKDDPELKSLILKSGSKCNDYMIVGYNRNLFDNSLSYSLVLLERVSIRREMY